jgi:hypothetical protein
MGVIKLIACLSLLCTNSYERYWIAKFASELFCPRSEGFFSKNTDKQNVVSFREESCRFKDITNSFLQQKEKKGVVN